MRLLFAVLVLLTIAAAGCALPEWEPPKQPYVDLQGSSDDYTQSKWVRKGRDKPSCCEAGKAAGSSGAAQSASAEFCAAQRIDNRSDHC